MTHDSLLPPAQASGVDDYAWSWTRKSIATYVDSLRFIEGSAESRHPALTRHERVLAGEVRQVQGSR